MVCWALSILKSAIISSSLFLTLLLIFVSNSKAGIPYLFVTTASFILSQLYQQTLDHNLSFKGNVLVELYRRKCPHPIFLPFFRVLCVYQLDRISPKWTSSTLMAPPWCLEQNGMRRCAHLGSFVGSRTTICVFHPLGLPVELKSKRPRKGPKQCRTLLLSLIGPGDGVIV